jgi:signal transduction histidine kinase
MEASPLSILITDGTGKILRYNSACRKFPGVGKTPKTENIFAYLTGLKTLLPAPAAGEAHNHLELEAAGESADGEAFLSHVWLTMYRAGPELDPDLEPGELRIAFVLWDASEDVRGRELAHSESLDATARVLLASFSHEVRNLSVAAGALAGRLTSLPGAEDDVRALSTVIGNLTDFAANGLKLGSGRALSVVDLAATMDQVHVTIRPLLEEANVRLNWRLSNHLPVVYAGHGSLMQVFLNLAANSARALKEHGDGEVNVEAVWDANTVAIRFRDNGSGVSVPENLFQPFQSASGGAGLGLYVSRAMLRSFGGDLQYEPGPGAIFVVRLARAPEEYYADTVTSD